MAEAISVAKEQNDTHGLVMALFLAATLGTLGLGFDRAVNASEFCILAACRGDSPRLGTKRFRQHG